MNIACSHRQHQIAGLGDVHNLLDSFLKRGAVADVGAVDGLDQGERIDAGDGSFTGRVNVDDTNNVRSLKAIAKFMQQVASASVAMRLKQHEDAFESALTGRFQGGANLCGVVAVIINDSDAADFSLALKATLDPAEIREPGGNMFRRDAKLNADGNGGGGISQVMQARDGKRERTQRFAFAMHQKLRHTARQGGGFIFQNFQAKAQLPEPNRR